MDVSDFSGDGEEVGGRTRSIKRDITSTRMTRRRVASDTGSSDIIAEWLVLMVREVVCHWGVSACNRASRLSK